MFPEHRCEPCTLFSSAAAFFDASLDPVAHLSDSARSLAWASMAAFSPAALAFRSLAATALYQSDQFACSIFLLRAIALGIRPWSHIIYLIEMYCQSRSDSNLRVKGTDDGKRIVFHQINSAFRDGDVPLQTARHALSLSTLISSSMRATVSSGKTRMTEYIGSPLMEYPETKVGSFDCRFRPDASFLVPRCRGFAGESKVRDTGSSSSSESIGEETSIRDARIASESGRFRSESKHITMALRKSASISPNSETAHVETWPRQRHKGMSTLDFARRFRRTT